MLHRSQADIRARITPIEITIKTALFIVKADFFKVHHSSMRGGSKPKSCRMFNSDARMSPGIGFLQEGTKRLVNGVEEMAEVRNGRRLSMTGSRTAATEGDPTPSPPGAQETRAGPGWAWSPVSFLTFVLSKSN